MRGEYDFAGAARVDKLLEGLGAALARAFKERPDVPRDDLLASIGNSGKAAETYDEFNASGEEMAFICCQSRHEQVPSVEGSTKMICDGCGAEVWMSPGTKHSYDRIQKKRINCELCAVTTVREAADQ